MVISCLVDRLINWLVDQLAVSFVGWFVALLIVWQICWEIGCGWLVGWLADQQSDRLIIGRSVFCFFGRSVDRLVSRLVYLDHMVHWSYGWLYACWQIHRL